MPTFFRTRCEANDGRDQSLLRKYSRQLDGFRQWSIGWSPFHRLNQASRALQWESGSSTPEDSREDVREKMFRESAGCCVNAGVAMQAPLASAWLAAKPRRHRVPMPVV